MTSAEIAYRMLRHCEPKDPAALTLAQATELMGALSAAMGLFFRYSPSSMRRTSASAVLPAETTVNGLILTDNARSVSGSPFTMAQRGATIEIEGDSNKNEITSSNGFLNPYLGDAGTKSATIYGDCVPIHSRLIERLISDPWVYHSDGSTRPLIHVPTDHDPTNIYSKSWWDWRRNFQTGEPLYYAIQETGISRESDAHFLVRVYPAPTEETLIRFEADIQPDTYDHTNLAQVPIDLPLSDIQIETILLPFCERELLASTLMKNAPEAQINLRAQRAEDQLRLIPANQGKNRSRIRTRRGF